MPVKSDKPVEVDQVEQLADEAALPDYPEGSPILLPMLAIRPRSRRAEFKRRFATFTTQQGGVDASTKAIAKLGDKADRADTMHLSADLDDLYQQIDELMEMAAVNPEHYREWSDAATDDELATVFNIFMSRSQPGEARSSTS